MPTFNLSMTFDATAAPAAINHGCTKAQRDALTDDQLIKVRDLAVKCSLAAKLTKGLQVSTCNPADLKDPNNFFNFVSQWESVILNFETHFKTFCMESPFTLFIKNETTVTDAQRDQCQFELQAFLQNSATNGGTPYVYTDPTSGDDVLRPEAPTAAFTIEEGGNILRDWHTMSLAQVQESVALINQFVDDNVDRQNLSWTFQYIMDCLDADLKTYVLSKLSGMDPSIGRTGPVVFMIVAQRILQTTENLAQKVINGFIALRLTHFETENVIEAIFTVRNVLKFLRYGEPNTFAPRTTIVLIYDVFRGTTVSAFRAYVQQAQDIVLKDVTDPEVIFDHLQLKYEELLLADRWVPTKKKQSVFHLGNNEKPKTYSETDKGGNKGKEEKKRERPTHDKSGRKIDYTPPKAGEPHERTKDGNKEFWCGKCGRWGSHSSDKHDEWRKNFNKNRRKKNNDNGDGNNNANVAATPRAQATTRGSVTFLGALTGNNDNRLQRNAELNDGIDF